MKRKLYRALYETKTVIDSDTGKDRKQARYIGPYFLMEQGLPVRRKAVCFLALAALVYIAAFLACGFLNTPGSRCFYVLPFWLFMPFPWFYWVLAIHRLYKLSDRITAIDKDESLDSIPRCAYALVILGILYALGDLLFMALGGAGDRLWTEVAGLAMILLGSLAAWLGARCVKQLTVAELPARGGGSAKTPVS